MAAGVPANEGHHVSKMTAFGSFFQPLVNPMLTSNDYSDSRLRDHLEQERLFVMSELVAADVSFHNMRQYVFSALAERQK